MTNPIETVVAPLKSDAMDRAEQFAREQVARIERELEANDWDREIVAPYPNSLRDGREEYKKKEARYRMVRFFTKATGSAVRRIHAPDPCEMNAERVELFVKQAREAAAAQYEAFVAKLIHKVGDVTEASLSGNHVWGHSILTVTKPDGTVERWKTQTIVNVSKLGTVFNQWPTRKVK